MEAKTAAENNDIRTLYKTAKKMRGGYGTSQDKPVKTVDGRLIKGKSEKISRWKEHFETTLNRPAPLQTSDIPEREDDIDISTDPITVEEVKQAIKKLKCGKAPGEDGVCAEMLKAGGEATARMLHKDFQCKVVCGQHLTDSFRVETGVKQGCILSPFLFLLVMDWLMRRTTADKKRGIQWTLTTTLEDLDFADGIGLLSNRHNDIQEKFRAISPHLHINLA
ncbi:hypothetical protein ACROYT_G039364 [Oculina patagonica]